MSSPRTMVTRGPLNVVVFWCVNLLLHFFFDASVVIGALHMYLPSVDRHRQLYDSSSSLYIEHFLFILLISQVSFLIVTIHTHPETALQDFPQNMQICVFNLLLCHSKFTVSWLPEYTSFRMHGNKKNASKMCHSNMLTILQRPLYFDILPLQ